MVAVTPESLGQPKPGKFLEPETPVDPMANGAKELELLVLMAERNWARGMSNKGIYASRKAEMQAFKAQPDVADAASNDASANSSRPPHSKLADLRQSYLSSLLRAQKIALQLLSLLLSPTLAPMTPLPLILSVFSYAMSLSGLGSVERRLWEKAKGEFEQSRRGYGVLGFGVEIDSEAEREAYRARVKGMGQRIRFCDYQLKKNSNSNDTPPAQTQTQTQTQTNDSAKSESYLSHSISPEMMGKIDEIIRANDTGGFGFGDDGKDRLESAASSASASSTTSVTFRNTQLPVPPALQPSIKNVVDCSEQFAENRTETNFLNLLNACDEATEVCGGKSDSSMKAFLAHLKITTENDWKECMITAESVKTIGVIGVLHLYDSILQGCRRVLEIYKESGAGDDSSLSAAEANEARVRALRCYYLGLAHAGNDDFTAALTLLDHALELSQDAASKLASVEEETGIEEADGQAKTMVELEESILASKCRAKAEQFLANHAESGGAASEDGVVKGLLDRKNDFDAGLVRGKVNVCETPPAKILVAVKPVFFDIAYNYLVWPDFDRVGAAPEEGESSEDEFDEAEEFQDSEDEFEDAEEEGGLLESVASSALGWFGLGGKK